LKLAPLPVSKRKTFLKERRKTKRVAKALLAARKGVGGAFEPIPTTKNHRYLHLFLFHNMQTEQIFLLPE
jgi:hypothetical protein